MRSASLFTLAATAATAVAQYKGFNYGSTQSDGSVKAQADFEGEFNTAKALVGTSGFSSARLYTMIQGGTTDTVISAIPAAISSETSLLLGMWASAGQADFDNELTALKNAITQYGSQLAPLVVGISIGSEDLYRVSPTGIENLSGAGANPDDLTNYISQVRSAIAGTALSGASIGHVDTWTAWVNSSNSAVVDACDWIGMDAYPYFQNTMSNGIEEGASLFQSAYEQTQSFSNGKDVWVTETGWPVSGKTENLGVPSLENAKAYWDAVGCDMLFGKVNTWWYTLQDADPVTPNPSFGVIGASLTTTPLYDLSCNASSSSSSSSSSAATSSATTVSKSVASATTPTTVPTSATSSVSENPVPGPSLGQSTTGVTASSVKASSVKASSVSATGSAVPSTTVSAVTTGSSTTVEAGETLTVYQTTLITITSCSTVCKTTFTTAAASSAPASSAASKISSAVSSASASASASACPANINGDYQYPHLIVPVSSSAPNTAYGTQYNATINSTVSTIFNFDIPESYAGKSCSLIFLFPELSQLETSAWTFNGEGGLVSHVLSTAANTSTTYNNAGKEVLENGSIPSLKAGNSYVISSDTCPPGTTVSFELSSTGGLALNYFEDYNPSPLGLYVRAC